MVFGLAQLTHDKVPFDLGDEGGVIYFQRKEDLTPEEFGRIMQLEKRAGMAKTRLEKSKDEAEMEKGFTALWEMQDDFVALILPDMPETVRAGLAITQQTAIIKYWRNSEEEKKVSGENGSNPT